jgi:hypothetical protein
MNEIIATYEEPTDDLETLVSELEGGFKVTILRKEPPWAEEALGTVDFSPGESISIDWVRNRYGGGVYSLRIKQPDGKHKMHRTVKINERPKNRYGIEIYPGPDGVPLTKEELQKAPAEKPGIDPMVTVFKEMMLAQAEHAKTVQENLMKRIESLEKNANRQATPAPAPVPLFDPQQQIRTTLETMRMMEELKESVRGNEAKAEEENPMLSKIMEKMIDRLTQDAPQPSPQPQQHKAPPLPPRGEPSNLELAQLVRSRLDTMDPDEKDFLLSEVFGEEEEDEMEEMENDTGQHDLPEVESLLSGEDRGILNEEKQSTPAHNGPTD